MLNRAALIALSLLAASTALAAPNTLSHQGRLLDALGVPLNTSENITFTLYDSPAGGAVLFQETLSTTLDDGYYSVVLGAAGSAIDPQKFTGGAWFGIRVGTGAELPQRLPLTAVPYAFHASSVTGPVNATELKVGGTSIADSSGKLIANIDWSRIQNVPEFSDTLSELGCSAGDIPEWTGSAWDCSDNAHGHDASAIVSGTVDVARLPVGTGAGQVMPGDYQDTLSKLSCNTDQIAVWGGSSWQCTDPASGGAGNNLVAQFEFEESTGSVFADTSGFGNDAASSLGGILPGAGGHSGNGLSLSDKGVSVKSGNTIPDSAQVWVEAWVEPGLPLSANRTILTKEGAYSLRQISTGSVQFNVTAVNGGCSVDHPGSVVAGAWTHVAGWYDGLSVTVAVNGNMTSAPCAKGPLAKTAGGVLSIGGILNGGGSAYTEGYKGIIDEVRIRPTAPQAGNAFYYYGALPGNLPVWRWTTFRTHTNAGSWAFGNSPPNSMQLGVAPSTWTDGNAQANNITADKDVLRSVLTQRGTGGKNASVVQNNIHYYSSTDGPVTVAMFRIRNTTGSPITWTPYFYISYYAGWSERASVALNGSSIWTSGGSNCGYSCAHNTSMSIPANRTSSVLFVSTGGVPSGGERSNVLVFYNNSMVLPSGLVYVDDFDTMTGGWDL